MKEEPMRFPIVVTALIGCAVYAQPLAAQCDGVVVPMGYHCVDTRFGGAALGYADARITGLGATPDRIARTLHLRVDARAISWFTNRGGPGLTTYDKMFVEMNMGPMTSAPLAFLADSEPAGLQFPLQFGYELMPGYRMKHLAMYLGPRFMWYDQTVGRSHMSGSAHPLVARAELQLGRRQLVAMAWGSVLGGADTKGAEVDFPLFGRLSLTAVYNATKGEAELWSSPSGRMTPATARTLIVGVRAGSWYH
jgi:hypothetical protein